MPYMDSPSGLVFLNVEGRLGCPSRACLQLVNGFFLPNIMCHDTIQLTTRLEVDPSLSNAWTSSGRSVTDPDDHEDNNLTLYKKAIKSFEGGMSQTIVLTRQPNLRPKRNIVNFATCDICLRLQLNSSEAAEKCLHVSGLGGSAPVHSTKSTKWVNAENINAMVSTFFTAVLEPKTDSWFEHLVHDKNQSLKVSKEEEDLVRRQVDWSLLRIVIDCRLSIISRQLLDSNHPYSRQPFATLHFCADPAVQQYERFIHGRGAACYQSRFLPISGKPRVLFAIPYCSPVTLSASLTDRHDERPPHEVLGEGVRFLGHLVSVSYNYCGQSRQDILAGLAEITPVLALESLSQVKLVGTRATFMLVRQAARQLRGHADTFINTSGSQSGISDDVDTSESLFRQLKVSDTVDRGLDLKTAYPQYPGYTGHPEGTSYGSNQATGGVSGTLCMHLLHLGLLLPQNITDAEKGSEPFENQDIRVLGGPSGGKPYFAGELRSRDQSEAGTNVSMIVLVFVATRCTGKKVSIFLTPSIAPESSGSVADNIPLGSLDKHETSGQPRVTASPVVNTLYPNLSELVPDESTPIAVGPTTTTATPTSSSGSSSSGSQTSGDRRNSRPKSSFKSLLFCDFVVQPSSLEVESDTSSSTYYLKIPYALFATNTKTITASTRRCYSQTGADQSSPCWLSSASSSASPADPSASVASPAINWLHPQQQRLPPGFIPKDITLAVDYKVVAVVPVFKTTKTTAHHDTPSEIPEMVFETYTKWSCLC